MNNFKSLGLKIGLEFHQRLDSHKLFCNCESSLEEAASQRELVRRLRPVAGELGEVDPAALAEHLKGREFSYQTFPASVCSVEEDEEPPHDLNLEALDIALEIALLLNCRVVDEVHVMRKTVIDGSAVSGFQRTALVASNGFYEAAASRVSVTGVYLEEESSGIVEHKQGRTAYRLDRQCVPLVEISTGLLENVTPEQAKEAALALGKLLRVTGKVQRGLGTIRQDVNISVPGGARIEVKGVQDVHQLDKVVENEAMRQQRLIELKHELAKRKAGKPLPADFSEFFKASHSKLFGGKHVSGLVLKGWKGLFAFELGPGMRFGKELAGVAKAYGLGGIAHSDEDLTKYGITAEVTELRKGHSLSEEDGFVFAAGDKRVIARAMEAVAQRVELAFKEVPEETRRSLPDATTEYMRPLPGEKRLYPETDLAPVPIREDKLALIKATLPKHPEKILEELVKKHGLSEELAERLVTSPRRDLFYKACELGIPASTVAALLESQLRQLQREGVPQEFFSEQRVLEVLKALKHGAFSKEALPSVLRAWAAAPAASLSSVLEKGGFVLTSENELCKEAKSLVKERAKTFPDKQAAFNGLMGELMKKYRGKADGALIAAVLKKELGLE